MAERKAVNKYYPPEWDPSKGSINNFRNSHPLRDRARKLDQGILVIRFEMPFNIWCDACGVMIGRGTRFNAEKKQNGTYLSSKIWQFDMKCANCTNHIIMETDPQNSDFVVKSGGRKKVETFEFTKEDNTISFMSTEDKEKLKEDPMFRLEHNELDKEVSKSQLDPVIKKLKTQQDQVWKDDYAASKMLRQIHRVKQKKDKEEFEKMQGKYAGVFQSEEGELGKLKLLESTVDEEEQANKVIFLSAPSNKPKIESVKRYKSIFGKQTASGAVKLEDTSNTAPSFELVPAPAENAKKRRQKHAADGERKEKKQRTVTPSLALLTQYADDSS